MAEELGERYGTERRARRDRLADVPIAVDRGGRIVLNAAPRPSTLTRRRSSTPWPVEGAGGGDSYSIAPPSTLWER